MRVLRILLVVVLLGVGVGAVVVFAGVLPSSGSSNSSQFISSAVTTRTITSSAVATGNIAAATTYSLVFGSAAQTASGATSSSSNSSSSNAANAVAWPVTVVNVKVAGRTVQLRHASPERDHAVPGRGRRHEREEAAGRRSVGWRVRGTVTAITDTAVTVQIAGGGTVNIPITGTTTYHNETAGSSSDVKTGSTVLVQLGAGTGGGAGGAGGANPSPGASGGRTLGSAQDITIVAQ